MKRLFLLSLMCVWGVTAARADLGDQYLEAYFAIQQGDAAERKGDAARAEAKFASAMQTLTEIQTEAPDWNTKTVEYRRQYCAKRLARLRAQRGAAPAPAATEADRIRQLTEELTAARNQIRQLEEAKRQLTAQLQEATAKSAAPELAGRVESLLQENRELAGQLAARQAELTAARREAAALAEQGQGTVAELRKDLAAVREELAQSRQQLTAAQADNAKLRASYEEVIAQLKDANRRLEAAAESGKKDAEIITQLRKEVALYRVVSERPAVSTAPARKSWWPFGRPEPKQETPPPAPPPPARMTATGSGKLVAEIQAPPAPPAAAAPAPGDLRALQNQGKAAWEKGDWAAAEAAYRAALAIAPDHEQILTRLGTIYLRRGNLEQAEITLQKLVRLAPENSAAKSLLGIVYFRQGKLDEAFGELTRAVALDPRNAEAHHYLGITLSAKGWTAAAESEMKRAVELNPKYADAHFNLAVIYARSQPPRLDRARYHYEKSLACGGAHDPQLEELIGWKK